MAESSPPQSGLRFSPGRPVGLEGGWEREEGTNQIERLVEANCRAIGRSSMPIFMTASAAALPLRTSTSNSRNLGMICSASSFFPRGIGAFLRLLPP